MGVSLWQDPGPSAEQFTRVMDVVIPGHWADNGHDDGNKNRNNIIAD